MYFRDINGKIIENYKHVNKGKHNKNKNTPWLLWIVLLILILIAIYFIYRHYSM